MNSFLKIFDLHYTVSFQNSPAIYIARDLVLTHWCPTDQDFELLCSWLTEYKLDSTYSGLSRIIFSKMSWSNNDLLPWKRHCKLAMSMVETSTNYAPDQIAGNFWQDSVRTVSNLAGKLRKTPEQIFTSWAWEMSSRLCLHRYDRCSSSAIIDLDLEEEQLGEAVATKNPLACYVALQTSQTGHVMEDVLERGLAQLNLVLSSGHYDHVLECVANIVPLFLNEPSLLTSSEEFVKIIQQVVGSDQTFLKMARDLVISDFPGPVLKELVNMIAFQMRNFSTYQCISPLPVAILWLSVLTEIPNWNGHRNVLFALEFCCQAARSTDKGSESLKRFFQATDEKLLDSNQEGFLSWLSGHKGATSYYTAQMSEFPWLSFFVLEAEEERQAFVQFWPALCYELCQNGELVSLDKCHKKVIGDGGYPEHLLLINNLPIYRWCQLILDCPVEQPMHVIFVQKFFKHFTARANQDSPKLGRFFFEGVINTHYFGRLLTKLSSIRDFFKKSSSDTGLADAFQAFGLWLEDMFILEDTLHLDSVGPRMMPDLLGHVLCPSMVCVFFMFCVSEKLKISITAS